MPEDDPLTELETRFRAVMYDPRNALSAERRLERKQKLTPWQDWCASARAEHAARELSAGTLIMTPSGNLERRKPNPVPPTGNASTKRKRSTGQ